MNPTPLDRNELNFLLDDGELEIEENYFNVYAGTFAALTSFVDGLVANTSVLEDSEERGKHIKEWGRSLDYLVSLTDPVKVAEVIVTKRELYGTCLTIYQREFLPAAKKFSEGLSEGIVIKKTTDQIRQASEEICWLVGAAYEYGQLESPSAISHG